MAVKFTGIPAQTGFIDGDINTFTGWNALTTMLIEFEVAGLPERHPDCEEIN